MQSTPWGFGFGVFFGIIFTALAITPAKNLPKANKIKAPKQATASLPRKPLPDVPIIDYKLLAVLQSATDPFGDSSIIVPTISNPFDQTTTQEGDPFAVDTGIPSQQPESPKEPTRVAFYGVALSYPERAIPYAPNDERTRLILNQPITVGWPEKEIGKALDQFADALGLELYTDPNGFDEAAVTLDQHISLELEHLPAAAVLRHLLRPLNLGYYLDEGAVVITSKEIVSENLKTRIYDVGDLIAHDFIAIDPRDALHLSGREFHSRRMADISDDRPDFDTLIETITSTISPDSWLDNGGKGSIGGYPPNKLIVSQTDEILADIERLLQTLREVAAGVVLSQSTEPYSGLKYELYRRLQETITSDWTETTLQEAIYDLAAQLDIPILFDPVGLEEAAVTRDQLIRHAPRVARGSIQLRMCLSPLNLTFCECDGVLLITSKEKASETLTTRVYNVKDLVRLDGRGVRGALNVAKYKRFMKDMFNVEDVNIASDDYDTLIELVMSNASPDSWLDSGGRGTISGFHGMIVISQTDAIHQGVRQLLAELRKPAGSLRVDVRIHRNELWAPVYTVSDQAASLQETRSNPSGGGGFF